ncbi:MAG TPA: TonB-dependent receptor plug domain-containing protein [Steroidobacteraceae bacterium]|nr:TonB-dependent receptor plug domain-containing protein [Steroidobacteraceae bacterium]
MHSTNTTGRKARRTSRFPRPLALVLGVALLAAAAARAEEGELAEVIVTATLRPLPAIAIAGSVSVLDAATLKDAGQEHFGDVLALVPNLNWAGDTQRPRYFQLRGIGELEQYQGAPNPSIGFLIDDIDFSGLGGAATMYDVDRVEVLRGPQGTRYGANALAGLIYVASAAPEREFGARADLSAGDYNTRSVGGMLTGPVDALDSSFRLAVQRYTSDGYYHNVYLNRYDTNGRDELTLRGRWRFEPSEQLRIDLTALHVQLDDGYDAYAPDNTRTTHSDQPSVDAQHSSGASLRASYSGFGAAALTGIATYAETRVKYGFDGDWGNPGYWAPYVNNFSELQFRNRRTESAELRLGTDAEHGFAWLVGAYAAQLRETLEDTSLGTFCDPTDPACHADARVTSGYRARNYALFGVLDGDFSERLRWSAGLRGERRTASYQDVTADLPLDPTQPPVVSGSNDFRPADWLWGGHASLDFRLRQAQSLYLQLARGYKAGGFNLSQGLSPDETLFRPEADWNLEAGYKATLLDHRLSVNADVFVLARRDAQIKTSVQSDPNNPNLFVYYTGNATRGLNDGAEASIEWQATSTLAVGGTLGILQTAFHDFTRVGDTGTTSVSRALANAPSWQAALHAVLRGRSGAFARLDVTGMGTYYFDLPPNPTTSHAYALLNAKVGWEGARWSAYLWGRNLLDKEYPVRGFYFGLEPPDYPNKLYLQLGDPRTFGADLSVRFGGGAQHGD